MNHFLEKDDVTLDLFFDAFTSECSIPLDELTKKCFAAVATGSIGRLKHLKSPDFLTNLRRERHFLGVPCQFWKLPFLFWADIWTSRCFIATHSKDDRKEIFPPHHH